MTPSRRSAEATSPQSPSYKWLVVAMLWMVCFFNYADRQAIFRRLPVAEILTPSE
jgi:hypothetical protein